MRLKPTEDRIVVLPNKPKEKTEGGIIIPAAAQAAEKGTGVIVAVGPGRTLEDGRRGPMWHDVDTEVRFSVFAGEPHEEDGVEYKILRQSDIIGEY